ncbi:MAG: HD domain-containing protein [bacterium]
MIVNPTLIDARLLSLFRHIAKVGGRAYFVGGFVRDLFLLGFVSKDVDIEVYGLDFTSLKACVSSFGPVNEVGKSFSVLKLVMQGYEIDLSLPRVEQKIGKGHKGFSVTPNPLLSYQEAALRRDFTINSMAYDPLADCLLDPYDGQKDIKKKVLRHVSSAFVEDPLRVYRAMQFAARFEFSIASETIDLCRECRLEELPKERVFEEIKKLFLKSKRPSLGLNYWEALGILPYFPELAAIKGVLQDPEWHPEGDVWDHTMMVVDELASFDIEDDKRKLILSFAALCHDFGKSTTTSMIDGRWRSPGHEQAGVRPSRSFLQRITSETFVIDSVCHLVNCHLRPALLYQAQQTQCVSDAAIRRLAIQVPISDLLLLATADHFGRHTEDAFARDFPAGQWLKSRAESLEVKDQAPQPLILGRDLIALGYVAGPALGKQLSILFEAQLEGAFSTKQAGLDWLKDQKSF